MGQIANQMVMEWCQKMIRKAAEKTSARKNAKKDRMRTAEAADSGAAENKTKV